MTTGAKLTLEEFWTMPASETAYELVDGQAIPKVSPKYFHSALQGALCQVIRVWCRGKGRVVPEWAITLQRNGSPWVPTPDVTYISYDLLPKSWKRNEACPVPPELEIEIISPGQTLKEFEDKAKDYLAAGVLRIWVIDPEAISFRVFFPDGQVNFYNADSKIVDPMLPGLELTPKLVFEEAELVD